MSPTLAGDRFVLRLVVVVGLSLLGSGLLLILAPAAGIAVFGLDPATAGTAFAVATGVRQAVIGALIAGLALRRERRTLGHFLLICLPVPIADAAIVALDPAGGPAAALRHLPAVPLVAALGLRLLSRGG